VAAIAIALTGALPAAVTAAPAFQLKATIAVSQITDWSVTQDGVEINSLTEACASKATVSARGAREIRFSTPTPLVLGKQELLHQGLRSPLKTVAATAANTGVSTMTFTGPVRSDIPMACSNGLCPVRAMYWFSFSFSDGTFAPCSSPLVEDAARCATQTTQVGGNGFELGWNSIFGPKELFLRLTDRGFPVRAAHCSAVGTVVSGIDHVSLAALTEQELEQKLRQGPLVVHGRQDITAPVLAASPATGQIGTATTRWEWTVRLARG
jgi:hypothetical protein